MPGSATESADESGPARAKRRCGGWLAGAGVWPSTGHRVWRFFIRSSGASSGLAWRHITVPLADITPFVKCAALCPLFWKRGFALQLANGEQVGWPFQNLCASLASAAERRRCFGEGAGAPLPATKRDPDDGGFQFLLPRRGHAPSRPPRAAGGDCGSRWWWAFWSGCSSQDRHAHHVDSGQVGKRGVISCPEKSQPAPGRGALQAYRQHDGSHAIRPHPCRVSDRLKLDERWGNRSYGGLNSPRRKRRTC